MLDIIRLYDSKTKKAVARGILEALPEWFGIAEAREEYIAQSAAEPFWCAYDGDKPIGFLYIHQTGDATLELRNGRFEGIPPLGRRQGIIRRGI